MPIVNTKTESRYFMLRVLSVIFQIAGWLAFIGSAIGFVFALLFALLGGAGVANASPETLAAGALAGTASILLLVSTVVGAFFGISFVAFGQLLNVAVAVEANTAKAAWRP